MHDDVLSRKLEERVNSNSLRELECPTDLIDFCSNDYLGFARSKELANAILNFNPISTPNLIGSGASRLISANNSSVENLEKDIAIYTGAEGALLFNSGYNSNLGFFSCVPQRGDVVFYDEYVHASIRDGLSLGRAKSYSFKHNELEDLKLRAGLIDLQSGSVFVALESVYSMDGDSPDLVEFAKLCEEQKWNLVVDEAHAFGVFGSGGQGRVSELNLESKVYARIITFGKAMGCQGSMILGSEVLRKYLINFARSLMYTTMLSVGDQKALVCAFDMLKSVNFKGLKTKSLQDLFKELIKETNLTLIQSESFIQSILIPGVDNVKITEGKLRQNGYWVKAILSPTVPLGMERIRICFHAYNTEKEVRGLVKCLNDE
ncbi:MAG: 8-amino-7-oxononanoate synthase [Granulosicoccus sp.]|jgi:8-amino-7-oxononanoate synthase